MGWIVASAKPRLSLVDLILTDRRQHTARRSPVKADAVDEIVAALGPDQQVDRHPDVERKALVDAAADDGATVALFELVAVNRIVEEIGEVRGQPEVVVMRISEDVERCLGTVGPLRTPPIRVVFPPRSSSRKPRRGSVPI